MRFLLPIFMLWSSLIFAQHSKIELKGKVEDATTNKPIEYATISVLNASDSTFIGGVATDSAGNFTVSVPIASRFLIKSVYIGYKRQFTKVEIQEGQTNVVLPTILLKDNSQTLNEVVIEGEKDFVQNTIDKQVYNVDKLGTTQGGTASDVLQNIPSVTIDQDGTPSMRGTNVIVLIDGRPSGLSGQSRSAVLDQIPASSIERIEVVSNPSAKYDPDGMSGIINVVLKKNQKAGYNGNAALTVGDRDKYNFNLNFNYKKSKLNWFVNYSFNHGKYYGNGSSDRKVTYPADTLYYVRQGQNNDNISDVHIVKTGIDYQLNKRNSVTSSVTFNSKDNLLKNEVFDNTRLDSNEVVTSYFLRTTNRTTKSLGLEWANTFTHNFSKTGHTISFEANLSAGSEDIKYDIYQTASTGLASLSVLDGDTVYKSQMPEIGKNSMVIFQADYSYPLNEKNRIDLGTKTSFRNVDRDFTVNDYNFSTDVFSKNEKQSNHFAYNENLYSAYGIFNGKNGNWGYQAGARVEQANTLSDQKTSSQQFRNDYFNLFPSAYLTYKPLKISELRATYSRRIVRPDIQNLNPFINYADRFTLRQGNPKLNPEYVNSYELGHVLNLKNMIFSSTIYYRQSTNLMWRYRTALDQGVTVVSYQNISGSETKGLELVHNWQVLKWWSLNTSGNLFSRQIFTGYLVGQSRKSESWNLKVLSTFRPFSGTSFTLSYTYDSPMVTPQGLIKSFQGLDVSASKDIFKKKASIGIRFSDVFNTRRFRMEMDSPQFTDNFMRKRESRNVFVTLTWRFGSQDAANKKMEKKKGLNTEAQSEDGG